MMKIETVKLYYLIVDRSFRKVIEYLKENNIEYELQKISRNNITWEQLMEILMYTENGVEDILSQKSKDYKSVIEQGIDFDEITLTQLQKLIIEYPKVLKLPITVCDKKILAGYDEEEITKFRSKEDRKKELEVLLK